MPSRLCAVLPSRLRRMGCANLFDAACGIPLPNRNDVGVIMILFAQKKLHIPLPIPIPHRVAGRRTIPIREKVDELPAGAGGNPARPIRSDRRQTPPTPIGFAFGSPYAIAIRSGSSPFGGSDCVSNSGVRKNSPGRGGLDGVQFAPEGGGLKRAPCRENQSGARNTRRSGGDMRTPRRSHAHSSPHCWHRIRRSHAEW